MSAKAKLGVLISGRGSNLQAIHSANLDNAEISIVISNRPDAAGLIWAKEQGLPTLAIDSTGKKRAEVDGEILAACQKSGVDALVLAGYDRIISDALLNAYPNRIVNIHPSLLPAYGGKGMVGHKVHEAVVNAGETQSGCTVHLVTPNVDEGPILGQRPVPVLAGDTPEALAARVLAQEHLLYPLVLRHWIENQYQPACYIAAELTPVSVS